MLSAVSIDDTACRSSGALDAGSLSVSAFWIGAACRVDFGSSNDSARLSVFQRDGAGTAMESTTSTWTARSGSRSWNAVAAGATAGVAWVGGAGAPGEPATIFERTTNSGANWTSLTTCNGARPYDIDALDDQVIYVTTLTGICRSQDGGDTWTGGAALPGSTGIGSITRVDMVSDTLGYAVAINRVYQWNGTTWSLIFTSSEFTYLASVTATSTGRVVIGGRTSTIPSTEVGVTYSTNGGASFTEVSLSTTAGQDTSGVFGTLAVDDSTFLLSTPRGRWRSTDTGATWNPNPVNSFAGEPFVRSDGLIFAATSGDAISRSADGGATWTSVPLGTGFSPHNRQVAGTGLNHLWVVGYADRRVFSSNAGSSWTSFAVPAETWSAAVAWDADRWAIAAESGRIDRTTNGGSSITSVASGTTSDFQHGLAVGDGIGILVGTNVIRRTTDFGATWSAITVPASGTWREIVRDDDDTLWIAGPSGQVASSTDLGLTWQLRTVVPGAPTLYSIDVWRDRIWIGGPSGQVWTAPVVAGALTWTAAPTGRAGHVSGIAALDATSAIALTYYDTGAGTAYVSRTTDTGATWTHQATPFQHVRDVVTDDGRRTAWVTGSGSITQSFDRGVTWEPPVSVGIGDYVNRMTVLGGGRLLAVGDAGLVAISSPVASVPDGMGGAGSGFGACLETAPGTSSVGWTLAGTGNCTSALTANWTAIAQARTSPTAVLARTAGPGTGTVNLRFGLRTSGSQRAGTYAASVVFEAVAPGV